MSKFHVCPTIALICATSLVTPDALGGGIVRFEDAFGICNPPDKIDGPGDPILQDVAFDTPDFKTLNIGDQFTVFDSDSLHIFTFGAGTTITFPEATTRVSFRCAAITPQVSYPSFRLIAGGNTITTFSCDIFHVTEVGVVLPAPTNQITIQFIGGSSSGMLIDDLVYGEASPCTCGSWWPMTPNPSSSIAVDDRSYVNDGALINGASFSPGVLGSAVSLDGIDDYVEVPDHDSLDIGPMVPNTNLGDFSLALWLRTSQAISTVPVLDKRRESSGPETGYHLFTYGGKLGVQLADGTESNFISSAFVADGKWHHVAVTVDRDDPAGITFYVDGVAVGPNANPTGRPGSLANTFPLRIGKRTDGSTSVFAMDADELHFCATEWTAAEVKALAWGSAHPGVTWTDLGSAKLGVNGYPFLCGSGDFIPNNGVALTLRDAAPNAAALLVISLKDDPTPFLGGILRPFPIVFQFDAFPSTTALGQYYFPFIVPSGLPNHLALYFQWIIQDSQATSGVSLSNAVEAWIP